MNAIFVSKDFSGIFNINKMTWSTNKSIITLHTFANICIFGPARSSDGECGLLV